MDKTLTLVLDLGSHASRTALFKASGELIRLDSYELDTLQPADDCYEQDPRQILLSFKTLLTRIPAELLPRVKQCGLCTQRSSILAWHKQSGAALSAVISWRDRRGKTEIAQLLPLQSEVRAISGLQLSPHYSASKISDLLNHNPLVREAARQQQLCIAPLASFLLYHLASDTPYVIDHSNAQRTLLFDLHSLDWSQTLLELFNIDRHILPDCRPVIDNYGLLKDSIIPITAVCGDQNAAFYAYPDIDEHDALINIGTGAFILSRLSEIPGQEKLLQTIASSTSDSLNLLTEGTVNGAGAAIDWAQQQSPCPNLFEAEALPKWLKQVSPPGIFLNSVAGLGSPWWCAEENPEYIASDHSTPGSPHKLNLQQKYVAVIESIAFLITYNLAQLSGTPHQLFICGGLAQLDGICEKLSTLTRTRVARYKETEASALGCARLASHFQMNSHARIERHFTYSEDTELLNRYQQFVGEIKKHCRKD